MKHWLTALLLGVSVNSLHAQSYSIDWFKIPQCGTGAVSVRLHHGGPQGAKPKAEVVADILARIKVRLA